jgi:sugar/nucleoside kinase (ribokinase family)
VSNEVVVTRFGRTDIDVIAGSGDIVTVGGIAKSPDKVGANLKKLLAVAEERGVRVRAVFNYDTSQATLDVARRWLGEAGVFVVRFRTP